MPVRTPAKYWCFWPISYVLWFSRDTHLVHLLTWFKEALNPGTFPGKEAEGRVQRGLALPSLSRLSTLPNSHMLTNTKVLWCWDFSGGISKCWHVCLSPSQSIIGHRQLISISCSFPWEVRGGWQIPVANPWAAAPDTCAIASVY